MHLFLQTVDKETTQMSCNFSDVIERTDIVIFIQVMQLLHAQPIKSAPGCMHAVLLLTSVLLASVNNVRRHAFRYTTTSQGLCNPRDV